MPIPHARRMNLIALALFIAALVSLVAFHLLPIHPSDATTEREASRGWIVWAMIYYLYSSGTLFDLSVPEMIAYGGLPVSMLLVVAAPFLVQLLRGSRPIWWIMVIMSSACLVPTSLLIWKYSEDPDNLLPRFVGLLMSSMYLNFLGLLFIRREVPAAPEVDPA